jgi:formamidopyrimidine-DNA glycosylase
MIMPEGVEVKLSAEIIRPLVTGHTIVTADFPSTSRYHTDAPEGLTEFLRADGESRYPTAQIQNVKTKGKFMYWEFKNEWYMFCTFGMTGQWSPKKGNHVSMYLSLVDNSTGKLSDIYFNDPRHFGTIKFVKGEAKLKEKLAELGWDPLNGVSDLNLIWVASKIKSSNKPIGQLLMDQNIFAGVGNYIRAEALYLSKMSPWRSGNSLLDDEIYSLCDNLIDVMNESYQHQGATIQTYATPYGEEGKYSSCFKVYGQKKDPLGNPIIKEETPEGRTIHWCPTIQS